MFEDEFTGPNDTPVTREFDVKGLTVIAKKTNPYGFFYFSVAKGKLPEWMTGAYTSFPEVEKAVERFIKEYTPPPEKVKRQEVNHG